MKQDKAMELVAALRSGNYTQTKGSLRRVNAETMRAEYCCLGVACEISKVGGFQQSFYRISETEGSEVHLPNSVREYFGFNTVSGSRTDGIYLEMGPPGLFLSLLEANDFGRSFVEIADYIEKNWEHL
jgi:hypothetical protein